MWLTTIPANRVHCCCYFWIAHGNCYNNFPENSNFRKHFWRCYGIQRFCPSLIHSFSIRNTIGKSPYERWEQFSECKLTLNLPYLIFNFSPFTSIIWFYVLCGIGVNNLQTKIWLYSQIHCTRSQPNKY